MTWQWQFPKSTKIRLSLARWARAIRSGAFEGIGTGCSFVGMTFLTLEDVCKCTGFTTMMQIDSRKEGTTWTSIFLIVSVSKQLQLIPSTLDLRSPVVSWKKASPSHNWSQFGHSFNRPSSCCISKHVHFWFQTSLFITQNGAGGWWVHCHGVWWCHPMSTKKHHLPSRYVMCFHYITFPPKN